MRLDFTGVEGQKSFEPLPAGKYIVEVTDYREDVASENAKNAGAQIINWEMTIQSTVAGDEVITDKNGVEVKVEGRKVWENMTIVEASFWRLKAFLEAAGFEADKEIDFEPEAVLNSQLVVKLGIQPKRKDRKTGNEYEARNKINSFHSLDESE